MTAARLLALAILATAFTGTAPAQPPVLKPTFENVHYGPHARQVLDFWQAKSAAAAPAPLLFFVHGGGWMNGDKANPDFLAQRLGAGISVASINYRLIPDAVAEKVDPPVRACLDDAARALQFVRSKSAEWRLDPARVAGCGGSAGGFTVLWLAFSPDKADPRSADPVARQSTRLSCAVGFVPQTSLDPRQLREWLPNFDYGHHAFSLPSYQAFLDQRERLLPWIRRFSPYELAAPGAPPVYLFYDTAPAPGQPFADPVHAANLGAGLAEKLHRLGIEHEFNYKGAPAVKHPNIFDFLLEKLGVGKGR